MPCTFGTPSPRRTQPWKTRSPKLQGSRGSWGSLSRASSRRIPHGIINWKAPHAWSQENSSTPPPLWGSLDCRVASNRSVRIEAPTSPALAAPRNCIDIELLLRKKYACGFLSHTFQLPLGRHWKMHFPGEKMCDTFYRGYCLHNALYHWHTGRSS